jgi:hypothetical protein
MLNIIKYAGHYVESNGLPEDAYLVEECIKDALNGVTLPVHNLKLKRIISEYWLEATPTLAHDLSPEEYTALAVTLQRVLSCIWKIEDKGALMTALSYHKNKAREYSALLDDTNA